MSSHACQCHSLWLKAAKGSYNFIISEDGEQRRIFDFVIICVVDSCPDAFRIYERVWYTIYDYTKHNVVGVSQP